MKKKHLRVLRFLSVLLSLLLLTALSACGQGAKTSGSGNGLVVVDSADSSKTSESVISSEQTEESSVSAAESESSEPEPALSVSESPEEEPANSEEERSVRVTEDGTYTSKEEVAAYLHRFGHLPSNYITKAKAKRLGWDSSGKNLWEVAPGMSIGGGPFGNYENVLPEGNYRECDIDFDGRRRGIKRLVYSDDGRIYYTDDHYETFERLY